VVCFREDASRKRPLRLDPNRPALIHYGLHLVIDFAGQLWLVYLPVESPQTLHACNEFRLRQQQFRLHGHLYSTAARIRWHWRPGIAPG